MAGGAVTGPPRQPCEGHAEASLETCVSGELLLSRLVSDFPQCHPRLLRFPSGSFLIDFEVRGATYIIEYVDGQGYGLSRQRGKRYRWEFVDEAFRTLPELEDSVRKLMNMLT